MGRRRVRLGLTLLSVIGVVGTLWFWLVEDFTFVEAAYQTSTTITTVGFGEVRPFDTSAQLFAIGLQIFGVSAALFTLGGVFQELFESQLVRYGRRRMDRRIGALRAHVIVCGYGRVGARIASLLRARDGDVVIVDLSEERCERASDSGYLAVVGDSTDDDILLLAGADRAATIVVSLASDADAVSTVLSARVLNPDARIVARANNESNEAKLLRAGCDRVVNPLSQGAQRLAAFAQQPAVADFLDVVVHDGSLEYRLEEVRVPASSGVVGTSLGDTYLRTRTGALVLAVRQPDGSFVSNPPPETVITSGVVLIAIGTEQQLQALGEHIGD
ncbi:MAG TPA: NAD-binding protein [Acidimicrobiia bacterium]|nr:NAD-binding protein [Acidimicrobiia bacterium]